MDESSYAQRLCAFTCYDRQNLPCWGPVLTTQVLTTEEGDHFLNTCSGHRLMLQNGPYLVEDVSKEFDSEK